MGFAGLVSSARLNGQPIAYGSTVPPFRLRARAVDAMGNASWLNGGGNLISGCTPPAGPFGTLDFPISGSTFGGVFEFKGWALSSIGSNSRRIALQPGNDYSTIRMKANWPLTFDPDIPLANCTEPEIVDGNYVPGNCWGFLSGFSYNQANQGVANDYPGFWNINTSNVDPGTGIAAQGPNFSLPNVDTLDKLPQGQVNLHVEVTDSAGSIDGVGSRNVLVMNTPKNCNCSGNGSNSADEASQILKSRATIVDEVVDSTGAINVSGWKEPRPSKGGRFSKRSIDLGFVVKAQSAIAGSSSVKIFPPFPKVSLLNTVSWTPLIPNEVGKIVLSAGQSDVILLDLGKEVVEYGQVVGDRFTALPPFMEIDREGGLVLWSPAPPLMGTFNIWFALTDDTVRQFQITVGQPTVRQINTAQN
jgi:hypothetical protein